MGAESQMFDEGLWYRDSITERTFGPRKPHTYRTIRCLARVIIEPRAG